MQVIEGLGVADGAALGKAVCISTRIVDIFQIPLPPEEVEEEVERFRRAVQLSREDIRHTRDKVGKELGEDLAGIFDAQALFLSDSSFLDRVLGRIRDEHVNAEWALHETATEIQARFQEIDDLHLRERSEDLRDVCRYLLRRLRGIQAHHLSEIEGDVVIVADDLTPSDAVRLGRENVVGFAIEHGSRTSHTTIIARSLNVPAVTGLSGICAMLTDQHDVPVMVDGEAGRVTLHPDPPALEQLSLRRAQIDQQERELLDATRLEPVTRDGVEIQVMANIELAEELAEAERFGAAGVGLYRSEFLYIEKSPELPTEEEHVEIYRRILAASFPNPAIIRTYDLGGRKIAREQMHTYEENPVLGLRGIRLTLARPEIFRSQLRALLLAGTEGNLWIMLPLVTLVEEIRAFRRVMAEVMQELEREGRPYSRDFKLGTMIEVPAAAMISDILAREVDFFSIGTNDLIQYSLAVDRNNEHVTDLYQPLHPAMVRMLVMILSNARRAGVEVSLCGEMGADTRTTGLLLGCGLRRISVSPRRVPELKRRIRELDTTRLSQVVEACAQLSTAAEVEAYLRANEGAVTAASGSIS